MVVKRGRKWLFVAEKTGKVLGRHNTKEEAEAQARAVEAAKANAKRIKAWAEGR